MTTEIKDITEKFTDKKAWEQQAFWTPEEVAEFLNTLAPFQAKSAKVLKFEVKILVIYPTV